MPGTLGYSCIPRETSSTPDTLHSCQRHLDTCVDLSETPGYLRDLSATPGYLCWPEQHLDPCVDLSATPGCSCFLSDTCVLLSETSGCSCFPVRTCVFLAETHACSCFPVRYLCIPVSNFWILNFWNRILWYSCQKHLSARVFLSYTCLICATFSMLWNAILHVYCIQ